MERYHNLVLVGTSHIAAQSIRDVEEVIAAETPEIVAVELDRGRFNALFAPRRKIRWGDLWKLGLLGASLNLLGAWAERKLARIVGTTPGAEIKKAIEIGLRQKAKIALIDQDIRITLSRLAKSLTWTEKGRFVKDLFKGIFIRQPALEFDLRKVPDEKTIGKLLDRVKADYPSVHRTLVEERNEVMARNLYKLMKTKKAVVAIVGAGHLKDLIRLIKEEGKNAA